MKHRIQRRKFDMPTSQRMSMLRNLTTDVLNYGYVKTTEARAKELRRLIDQMITLGKKDTVIAKQKAASFIYDKKIVKKLFKEIAPKYTERNGGYTRVIKLPNRQGDDSKMARIELV